MPLFKVFLNFEAGNTYNTEMEILIWASSIDEAIKRVLEHMPNAHIYKVVEKE